MNHATTAASAVAIAAIVSPVPSASTNAASLAARTLPGAPATAAPEPSASTSRSRTGLGHVRQRLREVVAADRGHQRAQRGDPERAADHAGHLSVPDATPAFVRSTAFIAAVLIGDIVKPIPSPSRMNGTTRKPKLVSTSIRDCQASETVTSDSPITSGVRGPTRSASRPASGPATMITSVEGRKRTPVSSGE